MARSFDQWEKDPFFPAAEEVQDSADRMESLYRLWTQERKRAPEELRSELQTALGTARWQLEELERAMNAYDEVYSAGEDTKTRHNQLVLAIGNRILEVENSLKVFNIEEGKNDLTWVRLDKVERDELALFLSGAVQEPEDSLDRLKNSCETNDLGSWETKEEMVHGHQRMASSDDNNGDWKISIPSEATSEMSLNAQPSHVSPRTLGFSGLRSVAESVFKNKWHRNGFGKWKSRHQHDAAERIPLHNHELNGGGNECFERSRSCLGDCDGDCYDKKLYGWVGALHRQLQRSQYHIQYSRPIQLIARVILAILLIENKYADSDGLVVYAVDSLD